MLVTIDPAINYGQNPLTPTNNIEISLVTSLLVNFCE